MTKTTWMTWPPVACAAAAAATSEAAGRAALSGPRAAGRRNRRDYVSELTVAGRLACALSGSSSPAAERAVDLLAGLNPPQRAAVTADDGPLLIFAGAGSGKTRVLTHRIAWLIQQGRAEPGEILAVTFTNKAAREMRGRVEHLLNLTAGAIWMGTFHAIAVRILRRDGSADGIDRHFVIYDEADRLSVVKRVMSEMRLDEKRYPPGGMVALISRGADVGNSRSCDHDYPDAQIVKLEQNYRSTQVILDAAYHVIKANPNRAEKRLWTDRPGGPKVVVAQTYDEQEEAQAVAREALRLVAEGDYRLGDIAILYRTNAQSRALEEVLLRRGVPYRLIGGLRFYERREVKDVLAYLRLIANPQETLSFSRVINVPRRKLGEKSLSKLGYS